MTVATKYKDNNAAQSPDEQGCKAGSERCLPREPSWRSLGPSAPGHHIQIDHREDDTSPVSHQQYVRISYTVAPVMPLAVAVPIIIC